MTSPGDTWAERNDTVNTEQKQELDKLRGRWKLDSAIALKNKTSYILKRSRADYLRVMGEDSESGLPEYQAECLEAVAGIGNHKEVAVVERERIAEIVGDAFEHIPEDTVLGKLGAEIQEEIRGVFSRKKNVEPKPLQIELSDGNPVKEIVLEAEDVPGPETRAIDIVRNKYVSVTIASSLVLAASVTGITSAQAYPSGMTIVDRSENAQTYITPADAIAPRATRDLGIYIPQMIYPFDPSVISDGFGYRSKPCAECSSDHQGVDFNPGYGAEIPASMAGTVIEAEFSGSLGAHVYIDDGYGMITMYGHMVGDSIRVNVGDKVERGQIIGRVGSTGTSTGAHLHFAIQLDGEMVDPIGVLNSYPVR